MSTIWSAAGLSNGTSSSNGSGRVDSRQGHQLVNFKLNFSPRGWPHCR